MNQLLMPYSKLMLSCLLFLLNQPSHNAAEIAAQIESAELIGGNRYMNDESLSALNSRIQGQSNDIPRCTHSFNVEILRPTLIDRALLRREMIIAYTTNPIPPAYQGPITRHTLKCFARVTSLDLIEIKSKLLYEYFE